MPKDAFETSTDMFISSEYTCQSVYSFDLPIPASMSGSINDTHIVEHITVGIPLSTPGSMHRSVNTYPILIIHTSSLYLRMDVRRLQPLPLRLVWHRHAREAFNGAWHGGCWNTESVWMTSNVYVYDRAWLQSICCGGLWMTCIGTIFSSRCTTLYE